MVVCPECGSERLYKDGLRYTNEGQVQRYLCRNCGYRFSENAFKECQTNRGTVQVCALKDAKNLTEATEINTVAGEGKGKLVEYAWLLKKRGLTEDTIRIRTYLLSQLVKLGSDLNNVDSVETVLATEKFTSAKKRSLVAAYRSYTKIFRLPWLPIKVHYEPKQPFIPTHEELTALIHAARKRLATFMQVLLDTGARCGEVSKLKWTDINTENLTISINNPEKHSRSRTLKVTQKTIAMLQAMPKKYELFIFNPDSTTLKSSFMTLRNRLAEIHKNPRFKQIHMHTFRHFYACNLFRKTKTLKTVQDALGHKSSINTEIYTRLVVFRDEEYYSATAKTVDEVRKLAEDGWTPFCEVGDTKVFRKPKLL
jgi:integrase